MSVTLEAVHSDTKLESPSYHDVHITTEDLPRTSIFNLPYGYELLCGRTSGWQLYLHNELIAGEYYAKPLRVELNHVTIVDSFKE